MATNDGFLPYPIGLNAADSVSAIRRAHELDTELDNKLHRFEQETAPSEALSADIWKDTSNSKLYRAHVEGPYTIWLEV